MGTEHTQVCCVLTGDWPGSDAQTRARHPDLGVHYVKTLVSMLQRLAPATLNWSFWCFTDRPKEAFGDERINVCPIPKLWSYFAKLWLFSPAAFPTNSRVLFFDLDTCVVRDWSPLTEVPLEKPVMLRDLWGPRLPASGIMSWKATSDTQRIWNDFWPQSAARSPYTHPHPRKVEFARAEGIRTDEEWLYHYLLPNDWAAWQDLLPNSFLSYKYHVIRTMRANGASLPALTPEQFKAARVVYFHGRPRPHEVRAPWNPFCA
ncbi:MAG: hypothetical protein KGL39_14675 [Patescibacteria group bacterium]|nr:hypothetical protein [Patescibacteria group bacterium]